MSSFTKEQLIERARGEIELAQITLRNGGSDTPHAVEESLRLHEIALASLEAEPVAYIIQDKTDRKEGHRGGLSFRSVEQYYEEDINEHELTATPLYTATPSPVAVPDEVLARLEHEANHLTAWHHIDEHSCKVSRRDLLTLVNACRAAMLQEDK